MRCLSARFSSASVSRTRSSWWKRRVLSMAARADGGDGLEEAQIVFDEAAGLRRAAHFLAADADDADDRRRRRSSAR